MVNATLDARDPAWWGQATSTASDSKRFASRDSNLMTEFHARYGGHGVMIYWHVERARLCIYSQLKSCSSSEVAAMIEGLLRHSTKAEIEANYTDTHGASLVGFAFTELLGFKLLPRLKNIGAIQLYAPWCSSTPSSCTRSSATPGVPASSARKTGGAFLRCSGRTSTPTAGSASIRIPAST